VASHQRLRRNTGSICQSFCETLEVTLESLLAKKPRPGHVAACVMEQVRHNGLSCRMGLSDDQSPGQRQRILACCNLARRLRFTDRFEQFPDALAGRQAQSFIKS